MTVYSLMGAVLFCITAFGGSAIAATSDSGAKQGTRTAKVRADTGLVKVGDKTLTIRDLVRFNRTNGSFLLEGRQDQGMARNLQRLIDNTILLKAARAEEFIPENPGPNDIQLGLLRLENRYFPLQKDFNEQELRDYYQKHRDSFGLPARVHIGQIQFRVPRNATAEKKTSVRKLADEVHARLVRGEDFARLANKYTGNPKGRGAGGDLGFLNRDDEWLETVVSGLEPGEISRVVDSSAGYEIIKLYETRDPLYADFGQVVHLVAARLAQDKQARAREKYIASLTKKIDVTYLPAGLALLTKAQQ